MNILLKKHKRYWLPTEETTVEETFIIENNILSIDDGDFACIELEVSHTVQCSWWNDADDEFTDCTIIGFDEDLLIVESPTGIKSKASIDCIRLKVKEFRGKLFPLREGFKICAPNMSAAIEGIRANEQKAKDAIKDAERKRKEEEQRKVEAIKQEEERKQQQILDQKKAVKNKKIMFITTTLTSIALVGLAFVGYILIANPYFKIEEQHQGYFYPNDHSLNTENVLTAMLIEGPDFELTKEMYETYFFNETLLKSMSLHIQENNIIFPFGLAFNFIKTSSSKESDHTYDLQTDSFEVIDKGIFFDDTYRVHCKAILTVENGVVNFTSKPYEYNDISTFGVKECLHTYREYVSSTEKFQIFKEQFNKFQKRLNTTVTIKADLLGKVYVDGKYKSKLSEDQIPVRIGKRTQYFTNVKLAEGTGSSDYIISSATLNDKTCVGTLTRWGKDLKVTYRCSGDSDFTYYSLTKKYK